MRALPGVRSASLATYVPMGRDPINRTISIEGHPIPPGRQAPNVLSNSVDPPYFETMRITLLGGRIFTESDDERAPPVAIINQTMASRFRLHEDPIGKLFGMNGDAGPFMEVVGMAGVLRRSFPRGRYHSSENSHVSYQGDSVKPPWSLGGHGASNPAFWPYELCFDIVIEQRV